MYDCIVIFTYQIVSNYHADSKFIQTQPNKNAFLKEQHLCMKVYEPHREKTGYLPAQIRS